MSNPGVDETLALLDALKGAIEEFAAREEKANANFRARSAALLKTFEIATRQIETGLAAGLEEIQSSFGAAEAQCRTRNQRRKDRINQAHINARKSIHDTINAQEEESKEIVRVGSRIAEEQRDENLDEARNDFDTFQQELAASPANLNHLENTAKKSFRGYGSLRKLLSAGDSGPELDFSRDAKSLFSDLSRLEGSIAAEIKQFRSQILPRIFSVLPIWLLGVLLIGFGAAVLLLPRFGIHSLPAWTAGAAGGLFVLFIVLFLIGKNSTVALGRSIAENLAKARRLLNACHESSERHYAREQERIRGEFEATIQSLNQEWKRRAKELLNQRSDAPVEVDAKARRIHAKHEKFFATQLDKISAGRHDAEQAARQSSAARSAEAKANYQAFLAELEKQQQAEWTAMEKDWKNTVEPLVSKIKSANDQAQKLFPPWDSDKWKGWKPPVEFKNAAKFGDLEVDLGAGVGAMPQDKRLSLPCPARISLPLCLVYPQQGSILLETGKGGGDPFGAMNNIIFRLLSTTPPGKLSFTIFDPVGLGEHFAALMHLADYEEGSLNSRIWTQQGQFEERLAELGGHMEKVIQMYLRNEYATIAEYNAQAGTIAEKYHFLVIASFPVNFSDTAARRLRNIAASGARCGVYTIIHWDQRHAPPQDFVPDELRKNSVWLVHTGRGFEFAGRKMPGARLLLDPPPPADFATEFLHEAGKSSKNSTRVEVPFEQVAPPDGRLWSEKTTEELRVPIGRSGATKLQYLEIGKGTRQHALIAGKTGSGKSTLFHVIITNLALWCSPDEVEFYLVDFKKGVEFKCYASRRLPHAKVVAIESDRAFGLSVLQRVDEELRRRGDMFRKLGAQDLAGYKRAGGSEPVPRSLLMIDEFQEFFVEEDRVSQGAAVLLDRIIRQGRAFGIHVILGSQTLGGAYTLARATIGQMVIRIALQCNEADAYLIMDQDNPAPRLLSRPGEGIYNDTAGSIEGNSPFQAVWISDQVRDEYLKKISELAGHSPGAFPGPFVFEGNAPADIQENLLLRSALEKAAAQFPAQSRVWLGSPNSIKGPTEAVFQRQSGSNLLIIGQSEERAMIILSAAMVALGAQFPAGRARFVLLDSTPPGFPQKEFLRRISSAVPHEVVQVNNSNLQQIMSGLAEELARRADDQAEFPETFLLIQGLQNFKKLRQEDEFGLSSGDSGAGASPAAALQQIISEGPARGMHLIVSCDTYANLTRFLGRKTVGEFEMRVLFQMGAGDSASLIDAPDASTLGFHRALLYHEREGFAETFRPYSQPPGEWVEFVERQFSRLRPAVSPAGTVQQNP